MAIQGLKDPELLRTELFVNGMWQPAESGDVGDVLDPANGRVIARCARGGASDANRAVDAAALAFPAWAAMPAKERGRIIRRWYDLIVENADDLALILTTEQGKPLAEAKGEILYGAAFFEWYAEEAKRVYGETIPAPKSDQRLFVLKQPIGVCAAITPWNFPMAMIPRKAAPALAAGCTMVLKPASSTPFSALALGELARRAGVPDGVFNIVPGAARAVGETLATHEKVRKLTFTGSTDVGRRLMELAAPTIKKLSLELGGNAPLLVFDDADVDVAVAGAMASKFRNAGQTCVCANRIYVQDAVYDEFVSKLKKAVDDLKVGDGREPGVTIGPLIDEAACEKVQAHIDDAVGKGAKVVSGGGRHELGGNYFQPTILSHVETSMDVAREETFGPLAPIFRFTDEIDAIEQANDTEYGLAAYLFTRDNARLWRVGEALEFGIVGANTGIFSYEGAPFGGVKASGLGREGSHHGIDEYLETKYLCVGEVDPTPAVRQASQP
jgi:succinate-semialdehyde dehydrogenase/glutarate-semialdehyde dehydrogenase